MYIISFVVVNLVRRMPRARDTIRDCYAPDDSCWHMSSLIHVVNTGESTIYFEQLGLCVRSKKGFLHVKPEGVNGEQIPQNLLPGFYLKISSFTLLPFSKVLWYHFS